MVGRRAELERERRLGSFLIELSRWLLATPDRDLLLRYTMQSLMSLVGAEGSYVALREPHGDELRVVIALGMAEDTKGMTLPLAASTTGRVVQSGQPLVTANIFAEPDAYPPANPSGLACSMMLAPLQTSAGVVGAAGGIRYRKPGQDPPRPRVARDARAAPALRGRGGRGGGDPLPQAGPGPPADLSPRRAALLHRRCGAHRQRHGAGPGGAIQSRGRAARRRHGEREP